MNGKIRTYLFGSFFIAMMSWSGQSTPAAPASKPSLAISLAVRADTIQPAGLPVLAHITVTNIGSKTLRVAQGGPGYYIPASHFFASIRNSKGYWRTIPVFNGQAESWFQSGPDVVISPGTNSNVPIALPALPPGEYQIQFESDQLDRTSYQISEVSWPAGEVPTISVHIVQDVPAKERRITNWIRLIAKRDPFATTLAQKYPFAEITDALVAGLSSADETAAINFARALSEMPRLYLPPKTHGAVVTALQNSITRNDDVLRDCLLDVAANIGSDTALRAVLEAIHSNLIPHLQGANCLSAFQQPAATRELQGFLKDQDHQTRFIACQALALRHDPAALQEMLDDIQKKGGFESYELALLQKFPDDPRVLVTLRNATKDPDKDVAETAQETLAAINRH